jgi:hypothetical protein
VTFPLYDGRGRPRRFAGAGHVNRTRPDQRLLVTCEACGASIRRPRWHARKVLHQFCDGACAGRWATEHGTRRGTANGHYNTITVPCSGCEAPVSKAASLITRRNGRVYCPACIPLIPRRGKKGFYVGYPPEFSAPLRAAIRKRDGYQCRLCGVPQREAGTLHVHHIDYDVRHNAPANLISLCRVCHGKTNFALREWTARLQALMH